MCISWKKDTSSMICTSVALEATLNDNIIFEAIYNNFCEKITGYKKQPIETFIIAKDLQSNLRFVTDRISVILDTKKVQDFLLAYFVSNAISELTRLIEKKDMKLKCYKTSAVKEKSPKLVNMKAAQNLETNVKVPCVINSVPENDRKANAINELINLAIHEAEEKARSFSKQETGPMSEAAPNQVKEEFILEKSHVENPTVVATDTSSVAVVQCFSQIDEKFNTEASANGDWKIISEISKNERQIEDSHIFKSDISSEKIFDQYTFYENGLNLIDDDNSKNGIVSEENFTLRDKAAVEKDNVPTNFMVPEPVDLSNNELSNIIDEEKVLPNNLHNNCMIPDIVDEPKNKFSEEDLPKSELVMSNNDSTPEKSETLNTEVYLSNSGHIFEEVGQSNNEDVVSDVKILPGFLSNNGQVISNKGSLIPEESGVPHTKLDMWNNGLDQPHTHDGLSDARILHEEVILFTNNQEIPLNGITCETSILVNENDIPSTPIHLEAVIQPDMKDNIPDENEDLEEHYHKQCLESIGMFYNITSFITQNICKDEFALFFYLKERVKFLYQARAAVELSKFSKENKPNSKVDTNTNRIDSPTVLFESNTSVVKEASNSTENSNLNLKLDEFVDRSSEISTNHVSKIDNKISTIVVQSIEEEAVEKISSIDNDCSIATVDANRMMEKGENICEEHNYCSPKDCVDNATISQDALHDIGKDVNVSKDVNICEEHNYCSPKDCGDASISQDVLNDISKDVNVSPAGNIFSNLQNELEEILELVSILEKKSEKCCYPNPFDAIPKILRALYGVTHKSPCKCVQEKLHSYIHDIVCWSERYAVGDINFVCQICHKTSVM